MKCKSNGTTLCAVTVLCKTSPCTTKIITNQGRSCADSVNLFSIFNWETRRRRRWMFAAAQPSLSFIFRAVNIQKVKKKNVRGFSFFLLLLFFFEWLQKENWLSTDRLPCPHCTKERNYFGKCLELKKQQHECRKVFKSWQINMTDGVKNVRCDCALQRLRSAFHPVFFFKSINHESFCCTDGIFIPFKWDHIFQWMHRKV